MSEDQNTGAQGSKVISVAGNSYVSGMFWQVVATEQSVNAEIKKLGESMGYDRRCALMDSGHTQVGFCRTKDTDGRLDRAYSLAAALRDAVPEETWAGLFEVSPGLWCYVAIRDSYILPDGDVWSDNPAKLIEQFDMDTALGEWGAVYGTGTELMRAKQVTLEDLLVNRPRKNCQVMGIGFQMPWRLIVGTAVFLMLMGGLFLGWQSWQEKQEREAAVKAAQAAAAAAAQAAATPVRPWNEAVAPSVFASRCFNAVSGMDIIMRGWRITGVTCSAADIVVQFARNDGTVKDLLTLYPAALVEDAGSTASMRISANDKPVAPGEGMRPEEEIQDWKMAREALLTFLQSIGVAAGLLADSTMPAPDAAVATTAAPVATNLPVKYLWNFGIEFSPVEIAQAMDPLHGIVITEMKLDANTFAWSIKGEMYGKR